MEIRTLGAVEVLVDGRPVALGSPKQRALLVALLRARGPVPREALIASLWGGTPPKSAVGSLQVYVHGLRRALGEDRVETVGSTYRLRLDGADSVDADTHERLVAAARNALELGRRAEAVRSLDDALALWRGTPLADVADVGELAAFARELEERRLEALELRNDAWLALGRPQLVLEGIERLLTEHPYRERLRAQHITALYRDGRQAEALAAYRLTRETWRDELGLEPTPALRELERAVLRHDETLAGPAPARPLQRRLPAPPTPLVGRRLEIASVTALLREARLVTILGAGGTGKTRLALAVADDLAGAVFVDLSTVSDAQLLAPAIAQALGLGADAPVVVDSVAEHLAGREVLLVLDNMEQIAEAALDVAALLAAAPSLRVLATSRTPLRLAAEHEYQLLPLPLPRADATGDEVAQSEAVQLFLARARAAGRHLEPDERVAELCRRLDGLPLALELAAARTKLLSPDAILERLERDPALLASRARDVSARHSTIAATIQWSLDLLDDGERQAFARLGVFVGGCTAAAAVRVGIDLDTLESIAEQSLVQRRGDRFVMLETVRPFAAALLEEHGGDAVRRSHAGWLTELAETIEAELTAGGDTAARLDELEAELDNIRAALEWTLYALETDLALRLISATRPVWEIRGHLREGRRWLADVLAAAVDGSPPLRAKVLGFAGTAALRRGEIDEADELWREMLTVYEGLGDGEGIARGLSDVGTAAAARGDWERSRELLEQAASRFRDLGEAKRLAVVLANLGHVAGQVDDFAGAAAFTREALDLQRDLGDEQRQTISLNNLASIACDAGDYREAQRWLEECLALAFRLGYREVVGHALVTQARIAVAEGDAAEAARLAAAADRVFDEAGVEMPGIEGDRFVELKEQTRRSLGGEAYDRIRAAVAGVPLEQAVKPPPSAR